MYQIIPTVDEVEQAYVSVSKACEMLNIPLVNPQWQLKKLGLNIVKLCGKPMLYRHEVVKLAGATV